MDVPQRQDGRDLPQNFTRELGRAVTFLHRSRTQDSIANHMFIDKCNVARRTKKLEDLGYLYRETDRNDRRQNNLFLTEKGRELVPVIRTYLGQWGQGITAGLTDQECATLLSLLTKMTGQAKK